MRQISRTVIFDRSANDDVEVDLIDGISWQEVVDTQSVWKPAMNELLTKLDRAGIPKVEWPEHKHWDWQLKFLLGEVQGLRLFGIHHELLMQGLMMVNPVAKSKLLPGSGDKLVYVDYLAAAPWNLTHRPVQRGRFGQVGRILLAEAVKLSRVSKFDGRIGLLALPQAVTWYVKQGMTEVPAAAYESLRYFEMTPDAARQFLPEE